jgi:hypothetical protein
MNPYRHVCPAGVIGDIGRHLHQKASFSGIMAEFRGQNAMPDEV